MDWFAARVESFEWRGGSMLRRFNAEVRANVVNDTCEFDPTDFGG